MMYGVGDEIANLGECVIAFGEWWHLLAFNFRLVAIAAEATMREREALAGRLLGYAPFEHMQPVYMRISPLRAVNRRYRFMVYMSIDSVMRDAHHSELGKRVMDGLLEAARAMVHA
jgi:phosphatidylethanolamine-binding protein (PEBP) family uncharacterized protein